MAAKTYDCIIIGGGPAGYTAAIYAARANLSVLSVSGDKIGGLLYATEVEDFPGFPQSIKGPELVRLMREQAQRFGVEILPESITKVNFRKKPFEVFVESKKYSAKTIIIATGSSPKLLGLPSEKKFWGKGVLTCAVCDGFFFKGKPVAIVGGGDTALKEALYMANLGCKVNLIHRRDKLRGMPILQKRVKENKSIRLITNSEVLEIFGDKKVTSIKIKNNKTQKVSDIKVDAIFIAIGHIPNTDFLKGQVKLDEKGHIITKNEVQTSVPGVFAAGDVVDFKYMQAITAAGAGCKAALDAYKFLSE